MQVPLSTLCGLLTLRAFCGRRVRGVSLSGVPVLGSLWGSWEEGSHLPQRSQASGWQAGHSLPVQARRLSGTPGYSQDILQQLGLGWQLFLPQRAGVRPSIWPVSGFQQ